MEIRAFECNVKGQEWPQVIHSFSRGKAKSLYFLDVHDAWPDVPYTDIRCRCVGKPVTSKGFMRNAEYRGIPLARIGMKVEFTDGSGQGFIVGYNNSANLDVLFATGKFQGQTLNCHPNHMIRYLDSEGKILYAFP